MNINPATVECRTCKTPINTAEAVLYSITKKATFGLHGGWMCQACERIRQEYISEQSPIQPSIEEPVYGTQSLFP